MHVLQEIFALKFKLNPHFQDKTALHFVIDPGFTLETTYDDWKTGDLRRLKRWPLIHSASLRS